MINSYGPLGRTKTNVQRLMNDIWNHSVTLPWGQKDPGAAQRERAFQKRVAKRRAKKGYR